LDEAYIEINPLDASLLGVQEGQTIKVQSRRGFINVKAQIKETVPRNTLFIPIHFAEASANVLTMQELDTKSGIPELKICAVRVES
jgi:formate dehydrogenase major subunit